MIILISNVGVCKIQQVLGFYKLIENITFLNMDEKFEVEDT